MRALNYGTYVVNEPVEFFIAAALELDNIPSMGERNNTARRWAFGALKVDTYPCIVTFFSEATGAVDTGVVINAAKR